MSERTMRQLYNDLKAANDRIAALEADLAAARAALEAVEWNADGFCPWCHGNKYWLDQSYLQTGIETHHAPDCARQVALGLAKKPEAAK